MLNNWLAHLLRGRGGNADKTSQGTLAKSSTRDYYREHDAGKHRGMYIAATCVLMAVLVVSAVQLISYASEYLAAQRVSDELREIYYSGETTDLPEEATQTPAPAAETDMTEDTTVPAAQAKAEQPQQPDPNRKLEKIPYPENPYLVKKDRFKELQRQNKDIIGWLKADYLIDEAVVQRNNTYYLDRDYLGNQNKNGALFLDENCSLKTRPYTLMIFGHNMQSGAMFGVLRNYENKSFLIKNPFISFESVYEKGRYVIFAVSTISTDADDKNYVNLTRLNSMTASVREEAINALERWSTFTSVLDVQAEDQLLLLITCVDDPDERRIVCARRVRDGESENALVKKLEQMWKK